MSAETLRRRFVSYARGVRKSASVAFTAICLAGVLAVSTEAMPALSCTPAQVHLSLTRIENAFTGGSYPVILSLRNVSGSRCSVEGHPLVVVTPRPRPYSVAVGDVADFDQNNPYAGPERVLEIPPNGTVHAYVVIGGASASICASAKSVVLGTVEFSFLRKTVTLRIEACRHGTVELDTGPFLTHI